MLCKAGLCHWLLWSSFLLPFLLLSVTTKEVTHVYGVLNSSVSLSLEKTNLLHSSDIIWKKEDSLMVKFQNSTPIFYEDYGTRVKIFPDGTLNLAKTLKTDEGKYTMLLLDRSGIVTHEEQYYLFITESKEVHPVYVILGSSVFLHAGNENAQSTSDIRWKKGDTMVVRVKNDVPHLYNDYRYRAEIFTNGTLRLDSTRERDSGIYIVERFNKHGKLLCTEAHHLITITPPGIETGSMYTAGVIYGIFRHFVTSILVLLFFVGALRCVIKKLHLHIGKEKKVPIQPKQDTETEVLSTTEF
ncbi:hypothetical protein HHUSO_G25541 [Huso huso]|uniref:Immunoglobulin subtype domain-containing protein n=1 Tax=Huso huso TaxID=61971 RepID=A0ABR0YQ03_HUSHU